jgi:c-di-GMP phosphodiesterase
MQTKSHRRHRNTQWAFTLMWLIFTILLLVIMLHYQWNLYHLQQRKLLQQSANQIEQRFDSLIDAFLHDIYSLPLYGRELKTCKDDLLPILQSLPNKNSAVLGVVLSDNKNKIICSTLERKYLLSSLPEQEPSLYGPIAIGTQPVFLLQQRLGEYYLGVYILERVFFDIFRNNLGKGQLISLYKINSHKNTLLVGDANLMGYLGAEKVKAQIKNLADYDISITMMPLKPNSDFLYHELPFILAILVISLILYFKFRSVLNNRFSLHYALTNALKNNHFQPRYQPVKDNIKNNFCGAEVLLRWQTDTDEMIMPDTFVSDAEKSGLIVPITLQLIEKSFIQCSDFLKARPDFHLAFNLSANHFIDDNFFSQFYKLCASYGISARQIMIELTERQLLDQDDLTIVQKMNDLRLRGYSLAIDDFGTGHASIKYLQHFPFNYLKIDKIFIQAIGTGAITETLNQAIIHLASCLRLNIIAEGVETVEQLDYLLKRKIQFVQGWYFARAMDYEQLIQVVNGDSG